MKIAYVFATDMAATYKLATMILPQLEGDYHGVNIVGMFFFDDNVYCLRKGDPVGERLAKIAADKNILLMMCDQCAIKRNLAEGELHQCGTGEVVPKDVVEGVQVGCFPQLYTALAPAEP
ncbi:MAG: SaoD/DsrE family protein, partial [Pseudomonadota bacterium]